MIRTFRRPTWTTVLGIVRDYVLMTVGAILVAVSVDLFLVPNDVVAGGITGFAQILNDLFGTPIGVVSLLMNIPLLALGVRYLGFVFGIRTIYATVALSLAIDLLAPYVEPYTSVARDPLLYTLYGGVLDGVGIGLVFRAQGTTGGIDIIARFLQRWRGIAVGRSLLVMNGLVFVAAAYLFSLDKLLYALLVAFVSGRVIDVVLEGASYARQALIITQQPERMRRAIIEQLDRSVTLLEAEGGYTATTRTVLLSVVSQSEVSILKAIIHDCDPAAFVIVGNVNEVLGEGFRPVYEP
jgi:uncharacterized membrane-anchored protein YitT (DUF2179 family)